MFSDHRSAPQQPHFFLTLCSRQAAPASAPELPPRLNRFISGGLQHLASGSYSQVFKTTARGIPAALKVIRCGLDLSRMYLAMRECAMNQLVRRCSGTVPMLEYDVQRSQDGFTVFILQEYRMPLDEYCLSQSITAPCAIRLVRELCTALEECRLAGVAHLDLQPGNLFVDDNGHALLGDFSCALPLEELENYRQLRGTLAYAAPEVVRDHRYSQAADVYSLGLILYSLLCGGQLPFTDSLSLAEASRRRLDGHAFLLPDSLDPKLRTLVEKACAHRPEDRYGSLAAFRQALDALSVDAGDPVSPVSRHTALDDDEISIATSIHITAGVTRPSPDEEFGDWATSRIPPKEDWIVPDSLTDTWVDTVVEDLLFAATISPQM